MNPNDETPAAKPLSVVPDSQDEEPSEPETPTYTLADQVARNTQLIAELAKEHSLDPAVVKDIFATTMHVHFTKIQLGLAAPVEG